MRRAILLSMLFAACSRDSVERDSAPASPPAVTGSTATATAPAAPALPAVEGPKLMPVDEATADAALVAYRERLIDLVRQRDRASLAREVDSAIRTSFGGTGGADDLEKRLEEQPGLWQELEHVLLKGGSFRGEGAQRMFWAPYVYSAWPEAHDAFRYLAVTGEQIPLHDAPAGKPIATLSWDIVERVTPPSGETPQWLEVRTADGRTGHVESKFLHSPVGYRAGFARNGDTWRMTALVAGD